MSKTAQEIAREALAANETTGAWGERELRFANALQEIAALPVSAPFALPVNEKESVRVSAVVSVWRMSDETVAIRTCPTSDEASVFAKPPIRRRVALAVRGAAQGGEQVSEREGFTPGVREYAGTPGCSGVTILHGRVVDVCPHRHKARTAAATCAEVMCAVRNESYFGKTKEASK